MSQCIYPFSLLVWMKTETMLSCYLWWAEKMFTLNGPHLASRLSCEEPITRVERPSGFPVCTDIVHPTWCSVWIDRFLARHHSYILIAMFDRVREWVPLCGWCKLLPKNMAIVEMCYKGLKGYKSCLQFQYVYVVHSLLPCPGSCTRVLTGCAASYCQGIWCD